MSLFVTGTDTGIGKTLITGALTWALNQRGFEVGCFKPIQSGDLLHDQTGDAWRLKALSGLSDPLEHIGHYALSEPLAPRLAAERAGSTITREQLLARCREAESRHRHLMVEGAGGLAVPLTRDCTVTELALDLGYPVLIVARPSLGTVNHTVLTVHYARSHGLNVAGVIISGYGRNGVDLAEQHNARYIEEYADVKVMGQIPWLREDVSIEETRLGVNSAVDMNALAPFFQ